MVDNTLCGILIFLAGFISFVAGFFAQISIINFYIIIIFFLIIVIIFILIRSKAKKNTYFKNKTPVQILALTTSIVAYILIIFMVVNIFYPFDKSEELWPLLSFSLAILSLLMTMHDKDKGDETLQKIYETQIDHTLKLDKILRKI